MMVRVSIVVGLRHVTSYHYERPVRLGPQVVRLRPAPHTRTPVRSYTLRLTPELHFCNWQQDAFGNHLARIVVPEPTNEFTVEVELTAELRSINPFDFFLEPSAEGFPFAYDPLTAEELAPYLSPRDPLGPRLAAWLDSVDRAEQPTVAFLVGLTRRLSEEIAYEIRMEPGVQPCDETLARAAGSCRDSAWLLVEVLRRLGLASRFVSGYLVQLVPDVAPLDGPAGPDADFTDLHAWAEVYLPGAGWFGLDATSGLAAGEGHIPLACAPTPPSAAPLTGLVEPAGVTFSYRNEVHRVREWSRVTKPYTDDDWSAIDALGAAVDADLARDDVRLTMGGEPTFVSVDDMEGEEWNTAADGPDKRRLAADLTARLCAAWAPGGVIHHGQGKWYPGEPLPRWAMTVCWRPDGVPVWRDPQLLAWPADTLGHTTGNAGSFARTLAGRLGIEAFVIEAFEDPVYGLWREAALPVDVDPLDPAWRGDGSRRQVLDSLAPVPPDPAGFVLPLDHPPHLGWRTSRWPVRRSRLVLLPGDSPLGYRLPLDALPVAPGARPEPDHAPDPLERRPPLGTGAARDEPAHRATVSDEVVVRTAVCVEARHGTVHVFLPPFAALEPALELLRLVEDTAAELSLPVVVEGYPAPHDARLRRFSVTPDPGVIEVNVHPAHSWAELSAITQCLYDEARQARLGTEKYHLDGHHTGTGGGNHVTLGGPTPADSPLLRRPSLLAGLLSYWQHHPSLSYLFSGLFVGPTSQAPRVDEARHENLHELEIALRELERVPDPPPWLVDRALRHLLTDLTGNTHRAEFCIDKLYSPDAASGRLGLLELRAFEMPPHARMAMVQFLLIRALVAWLWREPYRKPLVRWGTELHDRFLLPHYVASDIGEVVEDLRRAGYPFERRWLDPFLEFRFPRVGTVVAGDLSLELRTAIEPWIVLGEEAAQGGTARYVDSSMERLQVRLDGVTDDRHVVTCNGRVVPLRATGRPGEYVSGIRYRAWHPASALHPTIGVHSPLELRIVDRWTGLSVGGCAYHVSHPGGRAYEVFPVNALEAEARRASRFEDFQVSNQVALGAESEPPAPAWVGEAAAVGDGRRRFEARDTGELPVVLTDEPLDLDFPHTLDLRA
jgi:uncharacterized protein (DUF2126 family)